MSGFLHCGSLLTKQGCLNKGHQADEPWCSMTGLQVECAGRGRSMPQEAQSGV